MPFTYRYIARKGGEGGCLVCRGPLACPSGLYVGVGWCQGVVRKMVFVGIRTRLICDRRMRVGGDAKRRECRYRRIVGVVVCDEPVLYVSGGPGERRRRIIGGAKC